MILSKSTTGKTTYVLVCILCTFLTHCRVVILVVVAIKVTVLVSEFLRPLSHWKLISKSVSKFLLINSFRKKISNVNSKLSKEINFKILFRNLDHVLFCEISQKKFYLWITLIGHSASVYKHRTKCRRCWLLKVYFQCESAYFRKKDFKIFVSK